MAKQKAPRGDRFTSEVIEGHGGVCAFYVPFDPGVVWGAKLVWWTHPLFDGEARKGYPARIKVGRYAADGYVGYRWKRYFVLVDEPMKAALGLAPGDAVDAELWPRATEDRSAASTPPRASRAGAARRSGRRAPSPRGSRR